MNYKSQTIRKLIFLLITFSILAFFYLSGMYLWGADDKANSILNIIFGLCCIAVGWTASGLFKIRDLDSYLESQGIMERKLIIAHCEALNDNETKIKNMEIEERAQAIKERYRK